MIGTDAGKAMRNHLQRAMLSHLAMRWPKANAYMPEGGNRVHCAQLLPEAERDLFDAYVLAWQDAIETVVAMAGKTNPGDRPLALQLAQASVFQGGAVPHQRGSRSGVVPPRRGSVAGGSPPNPAKGRGVRRKSDARRRAEALFRTGEQGDA